jgi:multicomponent Na+:H+ antiporter subunit E
VNIFELGGVTVISGTRYGKSIKKLVYYVFVITVLCTLWIILTENISISNILSGFIVGIVCLLITDKVLLLDYYASISEINPLVFMKYIVYLFSQIYLAGFAAIGRILTGKIDVAVVEIDTNLESNLLTAILANSITLTPGTVTLDKSGNKLKVLWLYRITENPVEAGSIIKKDFENILMGGE